MAGPGAISKLVLSLLALLFSLNLVVTAGVYPTGSVVARGGGKPIKAELVGHAELAIPANRAVLTLRIASSGSSQTKVADDVRGATDEVLGLLRPHTAAGTTSQSVLTSKNEREIRQGESESESEKKQQWAPIVELSVNTVSSDLRRVNGFLLGEKDRYEARAEVSATFEARQVSDFALSSSSSTTTTTSSSSREGFDVLSGILATVGKMPKVTVRSLRWSLDDKTRKQVLAQIRTDAVQDAVDKLRAYAMPLLGKYVTVRAVRLSEVAFPRSRLEAVVMMDHNHHNHHQQDTMYDEHDAAAVVGRGSAPHDEKFSLEPRVLDVRAEIDGEFEVSPCATERAGEALRHWWRWCYLEISALGTKIVVKR